MCRARLPAEAAGKVKCVRGLILLQENMMKVMMLVAGDDLLFVCASFIPHSVCFKRRKAREVQRVSHHRSQIKHACIILNMKTAICLSDGRVQWIMPQEATLGPDVAQSGTCSAAVKN